MKTMLAIFAVLVTACASHSAATAPVTVLVTAATDAERGDAALLQTLTERAIDRRGASKPLVVSIDYSGSPTTTNIAPSAFQPYQTVFAKFTIADRAGHILHRELLRAKQNSGRLETLRDAADVIAQRVRVTGS